MAAMLSQGHISAENCGNCCCLLLLVLLWARPKLDKNAMLLICKNGCSRKGAALATTGLTGVGDEDRLWRWAVGGGEGVLELTEELSGPSLPHEDVSELLLRVAFVSFERRLMIE